ncbi:TIGR04084 family radical SAM/SPASM domain-containing protein [Candidatus Thorarchaeota archaeon]|nr:MAG: TIGR04084 family radical SAM/SPASM domain-containing protein [Candidatus Thorarchaeota archaeon]
MNYHLILTRKCNLNCVYCHGGEYEGADTEIKYPLGDLMEFLSLDPDPQLMFYGGEPTLRPRLLEDIMRKIPDSRFMLQTNATHLDEISPEYVRKFHSILVSVDGKRSTTDHYRSEGIYDSVISSVRWLRKIGYQGDIVARMAVSEETDIYRDVVHLLELTEPKFDHVHWQLNVVWDAEGNWTNYDKWVESSYKPGIEKLIDYWVAAMRTGEVMGVVPFLPIMRDILSGDSSMLRCGSGIDTFAIHVDGSIGVCPISPDWDFSIVGDIRSTKPEELKNIMKVQEPCPSCEIYDLCGGRCLFANRQRLWGEDGFRKICDTVFHLIDNLRMVTPEVKELLEQNVIESESFDYPEFNNGCEIIP